MSSKHVDLLPYVQGAPDQGESNTCWFMASTGAMELLLNKKYQVKYPKKNGPYDLSESFLIWQDEYQDAENPPYHFIESLVKKFNHGEAILHKNWTFNAYNPDGTYNYHVWSKHSNLEALPRIKVPKIKTELLFSKGRRYATGVLNDEDIKVIKSALVKSNSPIIVNYNDDDYWHVVLIVGFDDDKMGFCYEIEKEECRKGAFYVRDSNGKKWELRSYDWFRLKGNAAAVVQLKE